MLIFNKKFFIVNNLFIFAYIIKQIKTKTMKSNERILKRLETLKVMYDYNKVIVKSLDEQIQWFKQKNK